MRMLTSAIAAVVDGRHLGGDIEVEGCSIDSRSLGSGQLFIAVVADRDGHKFIGGAINSGAAACLVSDREAVPAGFPCVVVENTLAALTKLGMAARAELPDRVVGITGSVGKTSCKDLTAAALGSTFAVSASERSFNNEMGVPITLFNSPPGTDAAVIEMGARGPSHIAALCAVARPQIGVVTQIGAAHTELFGSVDDVIAAKGELVAALPATGTAVLLAGANYARAMAEMTAAQILTYGIDAGEVRGTDVSLDDELRPTFLLDTPWGREEITLSARGLHNVANAAAAAAAAMTVGASLPEVAAGLASAALSPDRMDLQVTATGARVLNDAYNANPLSVEAALRSLAALPADRRFAVLGIMAELGDLHERGHRDMGKLAAELGIRVIAVDEAAYGAETVADLDAARAAMGPLGEGDAVLVKGSRVAGLEALAKQLAET
jgi:UDP-N-acetylmuramoyl-tripeptide--D-alanyl-D-alanine ligase